MKLVGKTSVICAVIGLSSVVMGAAIPTHAAPSRVVEVKSRSNEPGPLCTHGGECKSDGDCCSGSECRCGKPGEPCYCQRESH